MKNEPKMVIVVRKDCQMRKGKLAAQCAHAALYFILGNNESDNPDKIEVNLSHVERRWLATGQTKIVVGIDSEHELEKLIFDAKRQGIEVNPVIDAGRTEFHGIPTLTCASFGPADSASLDSLTGHLKLM